MWHVEQLKEMGKDKNHCKNESNNEIATGLKQKGYGCGNRTMHEVWIKEEKEKEIRKLWNYKQDCVGLHYIFRRSSCKIVEGITLEDGTNYLSI